MSHTTTNERKISAKTYVCGLCGDESQHSTNHFGEIYTPCKKCGNGSLFCKGYEPTGLETKINVYRFDISDKEQAAQYSQLKKELKAKGLKLFDAISGAKWDYFDKLRAAESAKISFDYVFDNQWNTNLGRLFDWYEEIYPNKKIKQGYWLSLTNEHQEARKPKQYSVKTYYKGELIGDDIMTGINSAAPSDEAYSKYVPTIENFDIWSYKNEINLL